LVADRDLLVFVRHPNVDALVSSIGEHATPVDAPATAGVRRLAAALQAHDKASSAFSGPLFDVYGQLCSEGAVLNDAQLLARPALMARYDEARARVFPAYARACQALRDEALAAAALDPENGAFEVVAGLATLDLAVWPGGADALRGPWTDPM